MTHAFILALLSCLALTVISIRGWMWVRELTAELQALTNDARELTEGLEAENRRDELAYNASLHRACRTIAMLEETVIKAARRERACPRCARRIAADVVAQALADVRAEVRS